MDNTQLLSFTTDIVTTHLAQNKVTNEQLPSLVTRVYRALAGLGTAPVAPPEEPKPAVPVRSSVKSSHLTCLVCGTRQKTMRLHLTTKHAMTPGDYRAAYKLPTSYPMVAPDYTTQRREMALARGLGRKNVEPAGAPPPETTEVKNTSSPPKRRPRPRKKAAAPAK